MAATFMGDEQPGTHRCSGSFVEGKQTRVVMIVGPDLVVYAYDCRTVIHREPHRLPGDYVIRSVTCTRSPNSGNLVVTLGGFAANTKGQQSALISTDYHTLPPLW